MGFFDTLKVMKDIVKGGIASYKAGEKLDELIEQSLADYEDVISADEKNLHAKYKDAEAEYDNKQGKVSNDESNELLTEVENCKVAYLEALTKNTSLPKSFRDDIKTAVEEFKKADNIALDSLENTLMKVADTDEAKETIKNIVNEAKKK